GSASVTPSALTITSPSTMPALAAGELFTTCLATTPPEGDRSSATPSHARREASCATAGPGARTPPTAPRPAIARQAARAHRRSRRGDEAGAGAGSILSV